MFPSHPFHVSHHDDNNQVGEQRERISHQSDHNFILSIARGVNINCHIDDEEYLMKWKYFVLKNSRSFEEGFKFSRMGGHRTSSQTADVILIIHWNEEGLKARVPVAATYGWSNYNDMIVSSAADMKEAIMKMFYFSFQRMCILSNPNMIFLYSDDYQYFTNRLSAFLDRYYFLGTEGRRKSTQAKQNWPKLVSHAQLVLITQPSMAIGPVHADTLFS